MTSKEALEKLINKTGIINDTCAHLLACVKCGKCKFEEPIETCADYQLVMTIKKDLEILEIIKKWSFIQENYKDGYGTFTQFLCNIHTIGMKKDFNKIKEWLDE